MLSQLLILTSMFSAQQAQDAEHYRVAFNATRQVERSRPGDTPQVGTYAALAFVSASSRMTSGSRMAHVVVDSVTSSGVGLTAMAYDPQVGRTAKGVTYDFAVSSHLDGLPTPSTMNPVSGSLSQAVAIMMPTRTEFKKDQTWADTLDATPSPEALVPESPVVTHWKVIFASADSVVVDGDMAGTISTNGRVLATSVVTGHRRMTLVGGVIKSASMQLNQQMLLLPPGGSTITTMRGTTSVDIARIK